MKGPEHFRREPSPAAPPSRPSWILPTILVSAFILMGLAGILYGLHENGGIGDAELAGGLGFLAGTSFGMVMYACAQSEADAHRTSVEAILPHFDIYTIWPIDPCAGIRAQDATPRSRRPRPDRRKRG